MAARGAEPLSQFLERGIGLLPDQLPEPLQVLRPERRRVASAMGLGHERAGAAMELQQPSDEGDADQEATSDLAQGAVAALDRFEDPLPEILRIGSHRSPPHQDLPFKWCAIQLFGALGDFKIAHETGRGGMGVVYDARQVTLNRRVALMVLSPGLGLTGNAVARFRREAEAAARLHHTNIVPVYATGEQDGTHFYAMELIDGPSLDRVLRGAKSGKG